MRLNLWWLAGWVLLILSIVSLGLGLRCYAIGHIPFHFAMIFPTFFFTLAVLMLWDGKYLP